jgi:hypothetical protein
MLVREEHLLVRGLVQTIKNICNRNNIKNYRALTKNISKTFLFPIITDIIFLFLHISIDRLAILIERFDGGCLSRCNITLL